MRKIKWDLPFKNMQYLVSLTEELAAHTSVILITGIETEAGEINSCHIFLRESENNEKELFDLGILIGGHTVYYALNVQQEADEEQHEEGVPFSEKETVQEEVVKTEDDVVNTFNISDTVVEEEVVEEEVVEIIEKPIIETQFRVILRKILSNFKK